MPLTTTIGTGFSCITRREPVHARHVDVHGHDVGPQFAHCGEHLVSVADRAGHLEVRIPAECVQQELAYDRRVFDD
jgi:hypothetical protein